MVKAFIVQCFLKEIKKIPGPKCTMKLPGKYFRKPQHESKPLVFKKGYLKVLNGFTQLFQIILLSAFHLSLTD